MKQYEDFWEGKTFDDFLLKPQLGILGSRVEADLTMPLATGMNISVPIVGANMDTVTGEKMMKALSLEGCFGFIHRNYSIERQAATVRYVKKQHSYVIENPLAIHANATIAEAIEITRKHKISGLLVEKKPGSRILVGILSNRDIEHALAVNDIHCDIVSSFMRPMSPSFSVASPGVPMSVAEKMMLDARVEKLPLIEGGGGTWFIKGLITKKDIRIAKQKPYSSKDEKGRLLAGAAIGATGDYIERAAELIKQGADCILIDIAHGHSLVMKKAITDFRQNFGDKARLACGNVATYEGAKFLLELGADAIKIGVGPGRGCRTRLETGFGVPQLQAIREAFWACVDYAQKTGKGVPVIADGGIKQDKGIFLAIVCGASTVMLGSMLSGTDESPGNTIEDPGTGQKSKLYRGMTSPEAVLADYDEESVEDRLSTPAEGQTVKVPYVGSVVSIISRIRGHLKSAVSYAGEKSLKEARAKISTEPQDYLIPLSGASGKESFER